MKPLFQCGQCVATPPALALLARTGTDPAMLLDRHITGDWGVIDPEDRGVNEAALKHGSRILSIYEVGPRKERIWIMTEAVGDDGRRASTCIMLPSCY